MTKQSRSKYYPKRPKVTLSSQAYVQNLRREYPSSPCFAAGHVCDITGRGDVKMLLFDKYGMPDWQELPTKNQLYCKYTPDETRAKLSQVSSKKVRNAEQKLARRKRLHITTNKNNDDAASVLDY